MRYNNSKVWQKYQKWNVFCMYHISSKKFHIWLLRHGYPSNITYKFQPVLSVRFDWKYLQYVLTLVFRRLLTVWKLLDFYVIQILREITFGESKSFKTAVFAIFGPLDFLYLVNLSLQKVQKWIINVKIQSF